MLEKNEDKWKNKVRIVAASLDENKGQLLARIKEKGWNKIDHYILPGTWNHSGPKTYDCVGIPRVVLVNKAGKITYIGHPSKIDLETEINKLLIEEPEKADLTNKEEEAKELATKTAEGVPAEIYKRLRNLLKNGSLKAVTKLNEHKGLYDISVKLEHTTEFDSDLQPIGVDHQKLVIRGHLSSSAAETLKKTLADIVKEIPAQYIQQDFDTLKTVKIEFGTSCNSCSKPLTNKDAQYLSYQDNKYFCKACGEKEDNTKHGVERFVNPHALIYLNFKDPSAVEEAIESRIGDQAQPKTKEEEKGSRVRLDGGCDGCRMQLKGRTEFKCLACLKLKICKTCIERIEAGDQRLAETLKNKGHDVNSHILQKYCFVDSNETNDQTDEDE